MVRSLSIWLHGTSLSWAARGGLPWLWPLCETLHFIGMAMLIGIVGLLDLRMLGLVKGLPLRPLQRLVPWGVAGFVINLLTGITFYSGDPLQYIDNNVFWLKMSLMMLLLMNGALLLHSERQVTRGEADARPRLHHTAIASLVLWSLTTLAGAALPNIG